MFYFQLFKKRKKNEENDFYGGYADGRSGHAGPGGV
jgi:hypothetical protein